MISVLNIKVASAFFLFFLCSCLTAQKGKTKNEADSPTYTEDLALILPSIDSNSSPKNTESSTDLLVNLKDDKASVDSVSEKLVKYYSTKTKAKGWRVQIWDGQNHIEMNNAMAKYKETYLFLGLAVHDEYDKTLFRVKIGDFTDRLEAFRCLQEIKKQFPNALLVPDQVDLSKI